MDIYTTFGGIVMAYAYYEKIARINLTTGEVKVEKLDVELAKKIIDATYFYPPAKHFYRTSICGRACDRACYIHLEEKGVLTKKHNSPFRKRAPWAFSVEDFK